MTMTLYVAAELAGSVILMFHTDRSDVTAGNGVICNGCLSPFVMV